MRKSLSFTILFLLILSLGFAQESTVLKKGYKYNNNFEITFASNGNQSLGALSWVHFHSLTKKKRFKVGYGIRFNSQTGKKLYFTTAPASLTSKRNDPGVLFSKTYNENIDTFYVSKAQSQSLNISINLQYTIKGKYDIGFNIDGIGFSFGGKTTGKYIAFQSPDNGTTQTASPTKTNLLLISDNDKGSLNSELYVRYWFKPKFAMKVGASFAFTEYTTENKLRLDNDRWRNKSLMAMFGITFSPFR